MVELIKIPIMLVFYYFSNWIATWLTHVINLVKDFIPSTYIDR